MPLPACLNSPSCCRRQSGPHRIGQHAGKQCVLLLPKTSGPIRGPVGSNSPYGHCTNRSAVVGMVRSMLTSASSQPVQARTLDYGQSTARLTSARRTGLSRTCSMGFTFFRRTPGFEPSPMDVLARAFPLRRFSSSAWPAAGAGSRGPIPREHNPRLVEQTAEPGWTLPLPAVHARKHCSPACRRREFPPFPASDEISRCRHWPWQRAKRRHRVRMPQRGATNQPGASPRESKGDIA